MKIHDKYVIELSEVIMGYGNKVNVKEPIRLPCDYKFYEIEGVAICEESFKKMKPLESEINAVLDKIRAEIEKLNYVDYGSIYSYESHNGARYMKDDVLQIIDKYKTGKE